MTRQSVARKLAAIGIAISSGVAVTFLTATPALALNTCWPYAESTGSKVCYDHLGRYIAVNDTEADGHHAAAIFSVYGRTRLCEAKGGAGTFRRCHLDLPNGLTICFQAANMEGYAIVHDRFGREQISKRVCTSTTP